MSTWRREDSFEYSSGSSCLFLSFSPLLFFSLSFFWLSLAWSSLCWPGWPGTPRDPLLLPLTTGIKCAWRHQDSFSALLFFFLFLSFLVLGTEPRGPCTLSPGQEYKVIVSSVANSRPAWAKWEPVLRKRRKRRKSFPTFTFGFSANKLSLLQNLPFSVFSISGETN